MSQIPKFAAILSEKALEMKPREPVKVFDFNTHGWVGGEPLYIDDAVSGMLGIPAKEIPGGPLERGAALVHLIYTDGKRVEKKNVILRREPGKTPDAWITPPTQKRG